jgi:hypothetical protein
MSNTHYRAATRQNLDDMSEIEAMEAARRGEPATPAAPDPEVEGEPASPATAPATPAEDVYAKRYADLRRHAAQTEARLKQELEATRAQLEQASKRTLALPSSEDEIAAWTREYPDVARIVESIAAKKANERVTDTEKRIQASEARERESAKRAAVAELMRIHPDFKELSQDPAFHDWAGQQPRWVQESLYSELDPRSAARAIDLYKLDTAPKRGRPKAADTATAAATATPTAAARAAVDPNEGKKTFRESQVAKMSSREFERLEDEIFAARREGRFIYDLQSAA